MSGTVVQGENEGWPTFKCQNPGELKSILGVFKKGIIKGIIIGFKYIKYTYIIFITITY